MNKLCTKQLSTSTNHLSTSTKRFKAALTALLLLFTSTASYSQDHTAVLDEFSSMFTGVSDVGMVVSDDGNRYGIHLYGVNQPTKEMCDIFTKVDPLVEYVVVNHVRAGHEVQLFRDCR